MLKIATHTHLTPATGKAREEEIRGDGRGDWKRKRSSSGEGKRCRKEGERQRRDGS